jgi:hypothetical protein
MNAAIAVTVTHPILAVDLGEYTSTNPVPVTLVRFR